MIPTCSAFIIIVVVLIFFRCKAFLDIDGTHSGANLSLDMSQLIRNSTYGIVLKFHAHLFRASHPYGSTIQYFNLS